MKTERITTATLWIVCGALAAANLFVACSDHGDGAQNGDVPKQVAVTQDPSPSTGMPEGSTTSTGNSGASRESGSKGTSVPTTPPTPAETRAAWREGVSLYDRGDYPGASDRLTVAAAGRPESAYTHYLLGLALWKSDQTERSEQELTRSATLDPGSLKTLVNLARVRMETGDAGGALSASESALEIDPASAAAVHQKGRALAALHRADDAMTVLTAAHEQHPEDGYIANTLGWLLIQSGKAGDAVPVLESAREKLPDVAYVHNNLGVAYERMGRRDEAITEYRASVEHGDTAGKSAMSLARLGAPAETTGVDTVADGSIDESSTPVIPTETPKGSTVPVTTKPAGTSEEKSPAPSGF